jgi:hypothetical protein
MGFSPALSRDCCVRRPWHVIFEVDRSDSTAAVHSSSEIFNGVVQAVEEFIEVREPESMVFATKRDRWPVSTRLAEGIV